MTCRASAVTIRPTAKKDNSTKLNYVKLLVVVIKILRCLWLSSTVIPLTQQLRLRYKFSLDLISVTWLVILARGRLCNKLQLNYSTVLNTTLSYINKIKARAHRVRSTPNVSTQRGTFQFLDDGEQHRSCYFTPTLKS